ncbi:cation transporter, partial [Vibrio harveyi]
MCTKHQGCQSGKIKSAVAVGANDSCCAPAKPTLNITQASVVGSEGSCCSSGGCSSESAEDEGPAEPLESSIRHSWLVSGMDCPSCAQKLEKAITSVEGVTNAK